MLSLLLVLLSKNGYIKPDRFYPNPDRWPLLKRSDCEKPFGQPHPIPPCSSIKDQLSTEGISIDSQCPIVNRTAVSSRLIVRSVVKSSRLRAVRLACACALIGQIGLRVDQARSDWSVQMPRAVSSEKQRSGWPVRVSRAVSFEQ